MTVSQTCNVVYKVSHEYRARGHRKLTLTVLSANDERIQRVLGGQTTEHCTGRAEEPFLGRCILHGEDASLMAFKSRLFRVQMAIPNLRN